MNDAPPLLEVEDLAVEYPGRTGGPPVRAVDGVSLCVARGETLGLVGESGCGKSTTGRAILRLQSHRAGACRFAGEDVFALRGRDLLAFRRRAQIVFQDPLNSLNPRLTVLQTLAEPMLIHRRAKGRAVTAKVGELLERVGLEPDMMRRYPAQFSGGQRQRIGIARALAVEPELLVCDEPVSALDVTVQAQITALLAQLQADLGLALLFIAHDLGVVRRLSGRVAVMYLGRIVETGTRDEVYDDPRHPYTQALLSAAPIPDPTVRRQRIPLLGDVPSAAAIPAGCRFWPRCPRAAERCRAAEPPAGRAACWFADAQSS